MRNRPRIESDRLPDGEPRCEGLRSYLHTVRGKQQVIYVRCQKVAEHATRWHEGKSPGTGKNLKWDDAYVHARYLEMAD